MSVPILDPGEAHEEIMRLKQEIANLRKDVRVLAAECKAWRTTHASDIQCHARMFCHLDTDPEGSMAMVSPSIRDAHRAVNANPIARAAVEGE